MSVPLRSDGWAADGHADCLAEVEYLRARVEAAERVIGAARRSIARDASPMEQVGLVYAVNDYGDFLIRRPDRWTP